WLDSGFAIDGAGSDAEFVRGCSTCATSLCRFGLLWQALLMLGITVYDRRCTVLSMVGIYAGIGYRWQGEIRPP
ncbi:MAG: hypothetical protein ACRCVR_04800, partial [Plesiomonas shigelloides]